MPRHEGGCICGAVRYQTKSEPLRVTICHCTFCQRVTGSAFLVEPIFAATDFVIISGTANSYDHVSSGSGKRVTVHFCDTCGCNIYLSFERFPDVIGLFGGTLDDPNWFQRGSTNMRHIFTRSAQQGVVLPAGIEIYAEHAINQDGSANQPTIYGKPMVVESTRG